MHSMNITFEKEIPSALAFHLTFSMSSLPRHHLAHASPPTCLLPTPALRFPTIHITFSAFYALSESENNNSHSMYHKKQLQTISQLLATLSLKPLGDWSSVNGGAGLRQPRVSSVGA